MSNVSNPPFEPSLQGARVLVVEDEWAISAYIGELLMDCGCEVVGPANRVAKAMDLVALESIDGALLDLNLNGETVYQVAQALIDRDIPFAFVTGYAASWVSENYRERPALQKPINPDKFKNVLRLLLSHRPH